MAFSLKRALLKARINKFKNKALNEYARIITQYDLRISLSEDIFQRASQDYGYVMAQRGFLGWLVNSITSGKILLFALGIVLSILNPFGLPMLIAITLGVVSAVSFVSSSINEAIIFSKSLSTLQEEHKKFALSLNNEAKEQRGRNDDILSSYLIYTPYEIFANGSVYKHGLAGLDSGFSPVIPADVNKGILGEGVKKDEISKYLANTKGSDLAGGSNFFNKVLNNPFPNAKGLEFKEQQNIIMNSYSARALKTTQGFSALIKSGFGIGVSDGNFINYAYERLKEKSMKPFMSNLCQLDFLHKNRAYNKGLMTYTRYLSLEDFKTPEYEKDESEQIDLEIYERTKQYLEDEKMPLSEKVLFYSSMLQMCFESVFLGQCYYLLRDNNNDSVLNPFYYITNFKVYLKPIYAFLGENDENLGFFATYPEKKTDSIDKDVFISMYPNYKSFKEAVLSFFVRKNSYFIFAKVDMPYKVVLNGKGLATGAIIDRKNAKIDLSTKKEGFIFQMKDYNKFTGYKNKEFISFLEDKSLLKLFDDFSKHGFLEYPKKEDKDYAKIERLLEEEYQGYLRALFEESSF